MPKNESEKEVKVYKNYGCGGGAGGAVYGLGFVGALIYYLQYAPDFTAGLIGVFKALFWPAFLIYEVLSLLAM